jgi:hypothetical protein
MWRRSVAGSLPRRDVRCCVPLPAFHNVSLWVFPAAPGPGSALAGAVFLGGNVERAAAVSTIDTNQREDGLVKGAPCLASCFLRSRASIVQFRHILQLFLMNLVPDPQSHLAALGSVIFVFRYSSHGCDPNNHGQKERKSE